MRPGTHFPMRRQKNPQDFGLSRIVEDGEYLSSSAGTPSHMAPEVHEKKCNHKSDIWSCGVILYFLFSALDCKGILPKRLNTKNGKSMFQMKVWKGRE